MYGEYRMYTCYCMANVDSYVTTSRVQNLSSGHSQSYTFNSDGILDLLSSNISDSSHNRITFARINLNSATSCRFYGRELYLELMVAVVNMIRMLERGSNCTLTMPK